MRTRPRTLTALALIAALALPACTSENDLGKCVGIAQDDRRDPNLYYDLSMWNVVWGILGAELLFIPPILVLHHELYCPSGRRPSTTPTPPTPTLPPTNAFGETRVR